MTLEEAIADFESGFTVHDQVGCDAGAEYEGPRDMSRAPTRERYVTLTSGGLKAESDPVPSWFASEQDAVDFWLMEAKHYARDRGAQLYWREKPEVVATTFLNVNQAAAIQDQRLRNTLSVELHFVWCRLVVSKKDPSGREVESQSKDL